MPLITAGDIYFLQADGGGLAQESGPPPPPRNELDQKD